MGLMENWKAEITKKSQYITSFSPSPPDLDETSQVWDLYGHTEYHALKGLMVAYYSVIVILKFQIFFFPWNLCFVSKV